MHKSFIIFFFLYFSGACLSAVYGEVSSELNKNTVLLMMDDDLGNETSLIPLQPVKVDGDDHSVTAAFSKFTHHSLSLDKYYLNQHQLMTNRVAQRPLFLLFHSFLFYDDSLILV